MKTINTFQELQNLNSPQLKLQEVINRSARIHGETINFEISDELIERIALEVSEDLGGHHKTRKQVYNALRFKRPQHWGLGRFYLTLRGQDLEFVYSAGQDQPTEEAQIRTFLKTI